jgi:hypothetical protein
VFVSEGFDVALARELRDAVDGAQGAGPLKQAEVPVQGGELTGGLSKWIGSFGMMKVALVR